MGPRWRVITEVERPVWSRNLFSIRERSVTENKTPIFQNKLGLDYKNAFAVTVAKIYITSVFVTINRGLFL